MKRDAPSRVPFPHRHDPERPDFSAASVCAMTTPSEKEGSPVHARRFHDRTRGPVAALRTRSQG
ncbi:hypothetical protein GCM10011392_29960 [Wenxinia marina]|nr:hypothetical protein GCM10011392_29960 [Wenxinia marina]